MTTEAANEFAGLTLLDIAGLDTTGLEAKRAGEVLPRMGAIFECKKAELAEVKKDDGTLRAVVAKLEMEVIGVTAMLQRDLEGKDADYVGKIHYESRFIQDVEGIRYLLGLLFDMGVAAGGQLGDLLSKAEGLRFSAVITHRKDKNDSDKIYASLSKVKPYQG